MKEINLTDCEAVALGAGILGTGGGGNTYLGKIWLEAEFVTHATSCRIIDANQTLSLIHI